MTGSLAQRRGGGRDGRNWSGYRGWLIVGSAASPWSSAAPTVGRMIRLTREQIREASEGIDRFHQLADVAQATTDLEEHRRLWSEAGDIQRQLQELLTSADDGT